MSRDTDRQQAPELSGLLRQYEAGELDPRPVELGKLPEHAWPDMRRLADDMRLLMGLRLAVDVDQPLPYSARFAAMRMEWADHRRASRALRRLCNAGVIRYAGSLKPLGQPYGTKTYAPPLAVGGGAGAHEPEPVAVEPGRRVEGVYPVAEGVDEPLMGHAVGSSGDGALPDARVLHERAVEGLAAPGDLADGGRIGEHGEADPTSVEGGNDPGEQLVRALLAAFPSGELVEPPPPCPDPLRCDWRHRRAAGPWTCEHNHPAAEQARA